MPDKVFVGNSLQEMDTGQASLPISKVILNVDSEVCYIAGDDIGKTIEADCPWATQEMADNILSKMKGFVYKPFDGTNAFIDPAAELGDGVTVGGTYSILASMGKTFDHQSVANIGAPGTDEIEDEYPYKTKQRKSTDRVLAKTRSLISKTAEEVKISVEELEGKYTSLSVTLDGVTITDPDGTTKIRGSSIETDSLYVNAAHITGEVTASQIDATNLKVKAANITGALTIGQMPDEVATTDNIADIVEDVTNDLGYVTERGVTTIVEGTVTTDYVNALGVYARQLVGEEVKLLTSSKRQAGGMEITGSSSSSYAIELYSNAALRLAAYGNYATVYLEAGGDAALGIQTVGSLGYNVTVNRSFIPNTTGLYCGRASYKWEAVYAETGTIQTSDRNMKNSIEELPEKYVAMFDKLRPVRCKMNNGTSGRYHAVFIAQEVKEAMDAVGIDSLEFGGWVRDYDEDGNEIYMLRYEEYIPILSAKIKRQDSRFDQLDARVARLEGKTNEV